jgi:hypothetical protein
MITGTKTNVVENQNGGRKKEIILVETIDIFRNSKINADLNCEYIYTEIVKYFVINNTN